MNNPGKSEVGRRVGVREVARSIRIGQRWARVQRRKRLYVVCVSQIHRGDKEVEAEAISAAGVGEFEDRPRLRIKFVELSNYYRRLEEG